MTRKDALAFILAVVCLAGCTMIPRYSRPAPPIPAEWPTGPAYEAADEPGRVRPPQVGWREFYADERLQKVIELALATTATCA